MSAQREGCGAAPTQGTLGKNSPKGGLSHRWASVSSGAKSWCWPPQTRTIHLQLRGCARPFNELSRPAGCRMEARGGAGASRHAMEALPRTQRRSNEGAGGSAWVSPLETPKLKTYAPCAQHSNPMQPRSGMHLAAGLCTTATIAPRTFLA